MSGAVGLLLAAGGGSRAGGPKGLRVGPDCRPEVRRAAEVLLTGGCHRVVAVVGAEAEAVTRLLTEPTWALRERVSVVRCDVWGDGMAASLRAGLAAPELGDAERVVIHLVDLPDVGAEVVSRVLEVASGVPTSSRPFDKLRGREDGLRRRLLVRAVYGGRPGHPVVLGADHVDGFVVSLAGDRGGRDYVERNGVQAVECGDLATGRDDDGTPPPGNG